MLVDFASDKSLFIEIYLSFNLLCLSTFELSINTYIYHTYEMLKRKTNVVYILCIGVEIVGKQRIMHTSNNTQQQKVEKFRERKKRGLLFLIS